MGAQNPVRRTKTARELAEQFGASTRTVRRIVAEPREHYESRAAARRRQAAALRAQGMTYKQIAEKMDVSTGTVGQLLHAARKYGVTV